MLFYLRSLLPGPWYLFSVAVQNLGGYCIQLSTENLHLSRGESIQETALVLDGYLDGLIIRSRSHSTVEKFAEYMSIPVINALSDEFHPCQALADMMAMVEEGFELGKTKVCFHRRWRWKCLPIFSYSICSYWF